MIRQGRDVAVKQITQFGFYKTTSIVLRYIAFYIILSVSVGEIKINMFYKCFSCLSPVSLSICTWDLGPGP